MYFLNLSMGKINYKGNDYDLVQKSDNPVTIDVHFDSHGATTFRKIGGEWHILDDVYLPKDAYIEEIGNILDGSL